MHVDYYDKTNYIETDKTNYKELWKFNTVIIGFVAQQQF